MKFIFIYGPTAAGKFTVAKELKKIIGFKLLHNHLINDMLDKIIDSKKESNLYWDTSDGVKTIIIEKLSKNPKGVIFTSGYIKGHNKLPRKIKSIVEKNKSQIYFVKLECDKKDLLKRVTNKSRKTFGKFSSKKQLENFIKRHNLFGSLPFKNQLIIDNTNLPAKKVAQQIKKHYKL